MDTYSFAELNYMALRLLEFLNIPFPTEEQIQGTERFLCEVILPDRARRSQTSTGGVVKKKVEIDSETA